MFTFKYNLRLNLELIIKRVVFTVAIGGMFFFCCSIEAADRMKEDLIMFIQPRVSDHAVDFHKKHFKKTFDHQDGHGTL